MPYYLKTIAVFCAMVVGFRVMGKKAVGQMSNYDLAVVLILTTVIAEPLVSKDLWTALYGLGMLTALYLVTAFAVLKWPAFRKLVLPKPIMLISRGKLDEQSLLRAKLTVEEFLAAAREKGYTGPHEIEWSFLEPDGQLSFLPKAPSRPVQPPDLQLQPPNPTIPIELVIDGETQRSELQRIGKDAEWIRSLLAAQQIELKKVLLASIDQTGDIWLYRTKPMQLIYVPKALSLDPAVFDNPFPPGVHSA